MAANNTGLKEKSERFILIYHWGKTVGRLLCRAGVREGEIKGKS